MMLAEHVVVSSRWYTLKGRLQECVLLTGLLVSMQGMVGRLRRINSCSNNALAAM